MLKNRLSTLLSLCAILLSVCTTLYAQNIPVPVMTHIETDGSLGEHIKLEGSNHQYQISEKLGQTVGGVNLFHSFSNFNIGTNETATFSGPDSVKNIISRVTGGSRSDIDGTLESTIPNADMYFLNPYGIMFGPNAHLNVPGSFHASTANVLHLGRGGHFDATNPSNSLLTVEPPVAFGFLDNPAPIHIQGSFLYVGKGKEMSFIGGDIQINGTEEKSAVLTTTTTIIDKEEIPDGGRLNLAAIASAGKVTIINKPDLKPDLVVESSQQGEVTLSNSKVIMGGTQGGQIFVRAGHFTLDKATNLYADALRDKESLIDIAVVEDMRVSNSSEISIYNGPNATADSLVHITAKSLLFSGIDSRLLSRWLTRDENSAESLEKFLKESKDNYGLSPKEVEDFWDTIDEIRKETPGEEISWNAVVRKLGPDKIARQYRRLFIPVFSKITNNNVSNSDSTRAAGIQIDTPTLTIDTGIIESFTTSSGRAGNIIINTEHVALRNFGYLNAAVGPGGGNNSGKRLGGNIIVNATGGAISLSDFGTISVSTEKDTSGDAGQISLNTSTLTLSRVGQINSFSDGSGNAGDINITADNAFLADNSLITTEAAQAAGGNITLNVRDWLVLFNSNITAEAWGEEGNGGNLTIHNFDNKSKILALSKSQLLASANQGHGGDINVFAKNSLGWIKFNQGREFDKDSYYSVLDASSKRGYAYYGKIDFNAQQWEFPNLKPLDRSFWRDELSLSRCALFSSKKGKFFINARDILPIGPEDLRTYTIRLGNYY